MEDLDTDDVIDAVEWARYRYFRLELLEIVSSINPISEERRDRVIPFKTLGTRLYDTLHIRTARCSIEDRFDMLHDMRFFHLAHKITDHHCYEVITNTKPCQTCNFSSFPNSQYRTGYFMLFCHS